jgi:hypothetical protein
MGCQADRQHSGVDDAKMSASAMWGRRRTLIGEAVEVGPGQPLRPRSPDDRDGE